MQSPLAFFFAKIVFPPLLAAILNFSAQKKYVYLGNEGSGLNNKPVSDLLLLLVKITKSARNIWEPVIESVIILGFIMADTSSK